MGSFILSAKPLRGVRRAFTLPCALIFFSALSGDG
jgi:hypothetical protein